MNIDNYAMRYTGKNESLEVVRLLLEHGPKVNIRPEEVVPYKIQENNIKPKKVVPCEFYNKQLDHGPKVNIKPEELVPYKIQENNIKPEELVPCEFYNKQSSDNNKNNNNNIIKNKIPWNKTVFNTKIGLLKGHAKSMEFTGCIITDVSLGLLVVNLLSLTVFIGYQSFISMFFLIVFFVIGAFLRRKYLKVSEGIRLINNCRDDELAIGVIRAECFSQSTNLWLGRPGK
jgi:hypothetical protein